jgi:hypothetical protein
VTLAELSSAWNGLRNAAWGRGTTPLVSRALADRIGSEWDRFRAWYETQGSIEDWVPSVTANQWVERYRTLWDQLKKEGKAPASTLSLTWTEQAANAAAATGQGIKAAAGWAEGLAWAAAAAFAAAAVAVAVYRGKR